MKVFISHAEEDREIAEKLYNDLKNAGADTWSKDKDLLPGQNWREIIPNVIRESRFFIALLSSTSLNNRNYVQLEMSKALEILDEISPDDIFIIPVRLDECKPKHEKLQSIHTADLFPYYEAGFAKILRTLKLEAQPAEIGIPCIPEIYTKRISDCCKYMDINKLREKGRVIQVNLPEIFIPLYTTFPAWKRKTQKHDSEFLHSEQRNSDIEDLIAENDYLLIKGEAGSGKTTLLRHFAYMTLCEKNWKNLDGFLPILIFLKDIRDADFGKIANGKALAESILSHHLSVSDCGIDMETFRCFCKAGKAIILLDGLDEIAPDLRDKVVSSFADFRNSFAQTSPLPPFDKGESRCKIVLSGRPHGVSGAVVERFGDRLTEVLSLNMPQIEEFITRWFTHVHDTDSKIGEKTAKDMIGEIRAHQNVERLIDNPLLLTATCILYYDGRRLPEQRAELYDKFVNYLFRRFSDPENVRYFLMALATEMHTVNKSKGIDRVDALRILAAVYPADDNETDIQYKIRLKNLLDTIEPDSGLLIIDGGQYNFRHLTFQEFFAAAGMVDRETDYEAAIQAYWDDEWYREMIELYIGYLSIINRRWANRVVGKILDQEEDQPFYRLRLACRALIDIHPNTREPQVVQRAKKRLLSVFDTDVEPKARADAGEILGWLGDPRDSEVFVPVKGGKYELSTGTFEIQPFEMSKYPVTNQWYAKFVRDGGYDRKEFWTEGGLKWLDDTGEKVPRFWYDRKWNCPNAPVVGVNWYEAAAFAKWLTITKDDGNMYRLPDENEWEAAAAGFEKREYAYGNKFDKNRCNAEESGIQRTSSVGIFISGDTPEGISDLTGNVWEWMDSLYSSDSSGRLLRGGGWFIDARYCRTAFRFRDSPDYRDYGGGFRLVRLPQVSSPACCLNRDSQD